MKLENAIKNLAISLALLASCFLASCSKKVTVNPHPTQITPVVSTGKSDITEWLTMPDKSALYQKQSSIINFSTTNNSIGSLSVLHNSFPTKNIYFTEQYSGYPTNFPADLSWAFTNLIIGAPRNWSKNVLEWNLASDPNQEPHTNGGCKNCLGAITIGGTFITRNISYYIIAHASKFVRPGAVRIASDNSSTLPNVAFKNLDGSKVMIVLNNTSSYQTFNIKFNNKLASTILAGGAVATYVW